MRPQDCSLVRTPFPVVGGLGRVVGAMREGRSSAADQASPEVGNGCSSRTLLVQKCREKETCMWRWGCWKEKYLHGVLGWPLCPAVPGASLGFLQFVQCPAMAPRDFQRCVICYTEQLTIWQVFLWTLSWHYSDSGSTGCWLEFTLQGRMAPICLCILL